eukprot:TRINITY_DN6318_c0_g1_i2.p1 TRINITY_DN6318_c0_g1~~TRINITY_DN6318_c0_g1_i2.p1  ORF type:complete len:245 (+),score=59.64 TRINITY_DN6318_c0_g1_i2:143-877(+)
MIAYSTGCQTSKIQQWKCLWCTNKYSPSVKIADVFSGDKGHFFGFSGVTKNYAFITFRGTVGMENWMTDLEALASSPFHDKIPGARVHDGFLRAYNSMRDQVKATALKLAAQNPRLPMLVIGHSLGGALATLTAADFAINGTVKNKIGLWTFGSPRVGNPTFASFVNQRFPDSIRIVNQRDPVPHLPIKLGGFYRHINVESWFKTNTTWVTCPKAEDPTCSDSVRKIHFVDHIGYLGFDKGVQC